MRLFQGGRNKISEKIIKLTDDELTTILYIFRQFQLNLGSAFNIKTVKLEEKLKRALNKKRIKIASAKAKGRNLQKWAVERIALLLNEKLEKDTDLNNIRSREMGQSGTDVWIHKSLRDEFPIAVECKAQESVTLPSFIEQAKSNTSVDLPYWLLIIKNKFIKNPIAVMDWDLFAWLYFHNEQN